MGHIQAPFEAPLLAPLGLNYVCAPILPTLFAFPFVSDADVYLLDDPLAAVDAHVGQHLYERCITALAARGKCVVLVTNAVQFLRGATAIAVVKDGQVGRCAVQWPPRPCSLWTSFTLSPRPRPSLSLLHALSLSFFRRLWSTAPTRRCTAPEGLSET